MKNSALKSVLIGLTLSVICSFAILPLFHVGFFTIHDDEQIARLQQMYLVLSQGQIPPRWVPDLGFGFGFPLFNFYPPLVYYLGSLFHLVGFTLINSTKIVMGLGFLLSAGAMFVWVKKHFGIISGLFAALLYTYAPYHSVDLYVRGALSEFFSWVFIPLIFWSLDNVFETRQKKYLMLFSIFFALLMLSHSLVMLQFIPIFGLYVVFLFLRERKQWIQKFSLLSLGVILGLGITAYFWLPTLFEKQYTLVDTILTKELANYAIHFVCPIELWSGPWGYGGSTAGCVDGLSFQIGKIQLFVAGIGILLSLFYFFRKKYLLPLSLSVIFMFSVFLTLPYSKSIWDVAKPFWYIQFPWRYLLFIAVGSAFLGGFMLYIVEQKWGRYAGIVVGLILSLLAVYQVRNYFKPQMYLAKIDAAYTSKQDIEWRVSSLSYEYVPKEVATQKSAQGTTELAISQKDLPQQFYSIVSGKMGVIPIKNISYLKKLRVNVYNQGTLRLNTYNFPGWKVLVNGKAQTRFISNPLDLLEFTLSKGQYTVEARFENTPVRTIGNTISIISVISMVGLFFIKLKKYL